MKKNHTQPELATGTDPGTVVRARMPRPGRTLRVATALQLMTAAGNGLTYVSLSLRVYQATHSTLAVTMVLLAGGLPVLFLAPVAGLLLDRLPMGRLLSGAGLIVSASLVGLAFAHSLEATIGLVLCFGVADSVLQPGLTAATPQLAGDVPLVRATSRLQGAAMAGTAIGPLLAGVLGSIGGTSTALLLGAAIALTFAFAVPALHLHRVPPSPHGADDGVAAGLRYLRRDRPMGLMVAVVATMISFIGVSMVVELFLAEHVLHGGPTGFALLITAWTGGMSLGTVVAGRLPARWLASGVVLGLAVLGLGVTAGALSPTMWLAIVAYGIGGIGDGMQLVGARALLLQRAPAHIAGRACSVLTGATMGAVSVGTACATPLVALLGIRGALCAAGLASVLAAVAALALGLHHLRGEPFVDVTVEGAGPVASGSPALL